jgi:hypothetical protein
LWWRERVTLINVRTKLLRLSEGRMNLIKRDAGKRRRRIGSWVPSTVVVVS